MANVSSPNSLPLVKGAVEDVVYAPSVLPTSGKGSFDIFQHCMDLIGAFANDKSESYISNIVQEKLARRRIALYYRRPKKTPSTKGLLPRPRRAPAAAPARGKTVRRASPELLECVRRLEEANAGSAVIPGLRLRVVASRAMPHLAGRTFVCVGVTRGARCVALCDPARKTVVLSPVRALDACAVAQLGETLPFSHLLKLFSY